MFNLEQTPILIGAVGFVLALCAMRMGLAISRRLLGTERKGAPPAGQAAFDGQEHSLRSLEAELRVARKKAEVAEERIVELEQELEEVRAERDGLKRTIEKRDDQLADADKTLKDEIAKTVALRHRLTDQAEETIRAQVKARDIETELSIRQAGLNLDDDALEQIAAEHEELTGRLKALQAKISERS